MPREREEPVSKDFPAEQPKLSGARKEKLISPTVVFNKVPEQARLPSLEAMGDLSVGQLSKVLDAYGVTDPWDSMRVDAMSYLNRMNVPLHRMDAAVEGLLNHERKAQLMLARRVSERWATMNSLEGDYSQTMAWITVGDDAMCDPCDDNGGLEMPYTEWLQYGLPGAQTCDGADYCRCELVLVTD